MLDERTRRIQQLNDNLRRTFTGGRILITAGIQALGAETQAAVLKAIVQFDRWTPDNDPHHQHDCAILEVGEVRVMFKVDYYDPSLGFLSPDPSNERLTRRVLTILLAEEY